MNNKKINFWFGDGMWLLWLALLFSLLPFIGVFELLINTTMDL